MENVLPHNGRRSPHGLPDLGEFIQFDGECPDTPTAVAALLREIAVKTQGSHLQHFYSIRSVADHFHVPPAMVSRIYHRLGAEGLLRMVWGSKTLLEPMKSARNGDSRCVGIPVDIGRFASGTEYRDLILLLQSEMWNHELDEHFLFFRDQEDEVVSLCKRAHHPHVDTVIWLFPSDLCKQTLLRLHDLGLQVFCLTERPKARLPYCHTISDRLSIRKVIRKQLLRI